MEVAAIPLAAAPTASIRVPAASAVPTVATVEAVSVAGGTIPTAAYTVLRGIGTVRCLPQIRPNWVLCVPVSRQTACTTTKTISPGTEREHSKSARELLFIHLGPRLNISRMYFFLNLFCNAWPTWPISTVETLDQLHRQGHVGAICPPLGESTFSVRGSHEVVGNTTLLCSYLHSAFLVQSKTLSLISRLLIAARRAICRKECKRVRPETPSARSRINHNRRQRQTKGEIRR